MLISKFDLYKTEWLELVFDNRNKAYGAYELRQHNSRTMLTAMGIAIVGISVPLIIIGALVKPVITAIPLFHVIPVTTIVIEHPAVAHPHQSHSHISPPPAQTSPANTPRIFVPVATPPPATVQPTRVDPTPTGDLGVLNQSIDDGVKGGTGKTPGTTTESGNDVGNAPFNTVEKMPEPYGGAAAWNKFLGKNLKYPDMAVDQHIQGKVWVSFIVEKDGRLSNIVVERGPGYGTNEEAARVLKMSPPWKPGIQNGQPVRVRFNIPINFQLTDDNN